MAFPGLWGGTVDCKEEKNAENTRDQKHSSKALIARLHSFRFRPFYCALATGMHWIGRRRERKEDTDTTQLPVGDRIETFVYSLLTQEKYPASKLILY